MRRFVKLVLWGSIATLLAVFALEALDGRGFLRFPTGEAEDRFLSACYSAAGTAFLLATWAGVTAFFLKHGGPVVETKTEPGPIYEDLAELRRMWGEGVRARDWPSDEIRRALDPGKPLWFRSYANLVAYYHSLDQHRLEAALVHITAAYEGALGYVWGDDDFVPRLAYEGAFVRGLLNQDLADAAALLGHYSYPVDDAECARLRAKAILHARLGELDKARETLDNARTHVAAKFPVMKPNVQAELDWLEQIDQLLPKE